jgi:hypothetical protein
MAARFFIYDWKLRKDQSNAQQGQDVMSISEAGAGIARFFMDLQQIRPYKVL